MPKINLRDQDPTTGGTPPVASADDMIQPPLPREMESSEVPKWLMIVGGLLICLVLVVALNQFKVIHLWGKKTPKIVEALPEPSVQAPHVDATVPAPSVSQAPATPQATVDNTPAPAEPVKVTPPEPAPSANVAPDVAPAKPVPPPQHVSGTFAIQMSSWPTRHAADKAAQSLSRTGQTVEIVQATVNGKSWYRVRFGSYGSESDAERGLQELHQKGVVGGIVANAGH